MAKQGFVVPAGGGKHFFWSDHGLSSVAVQNHELPLRLERGF